MQIPEDIITTPVALADQYFDLQGLNTYSCIPVPTLRDYIKRDGMPCFKLKGKILVKRSEFDSWMNGHRVDGIDVLKAKAIEALERLTAKSDTQSEGH
ncbi:MAG: helix-turn-helix domain-containing protein [Deltaproteobacteria bacterium]|nr:helix-turn-helix domain-containing protein [Deltaproteobacteria bacterium]